MDTAPTAPRRTDIAWIKGRRLGAGSFGTVFKALDPDTLSVFAVKEMPLEDESHSGAKQRKRLDLELSICQSLSHPNIVRYLGHDYTDEHLFIYLEYMPGGSMSSLLNEFGALKGGVLQKAMAGMLHGLDYLHTQSPPVVHRDLKGANLLVDLHMSVKLADFGCSKWSVDTKSFSTIGSVPWMAPEVINQRDGHGRNADIWSFGCTAIEMATAEKPWGNRAFDSLPHAMHRIANSIETPPVPEHTSSECRGMIGWCARRAPQGRPSTTELLQHDFFATRDTGAKSARPG